MANLLINTTVGGNAVITTSNIGSYALTSIPATIGPTNINIGNAIYFGGGNNYLNWDGSRINSNVGIQSTSDMRAPIFYDSANTNFYGDFASTSVVNAIRFGNSSNNGTLSAPSDWGMRLTTDAGYIQFGPANSSYAHIYTDRDTFYFNKALLINGSTVITAATIGSQTVAIAGSLTSMNISQFTNNSGYLTSVSDIWVNTTGDTMTGPLTVPYLNITEPVETFNPFGPFKMHDSILSNSMVGRWDRFDVTINGTLVPGASVNLSNQNFEEYNGNGLFGTDAGETKVFNINVQKLESGSISSSGITYCNGYFDICFYSSPFPASWSARVKDKNGNYTTVTSLTQIGSSKLRGIIPIGNWLTDIEFTLVARTSAPYVTGNITYGISEFELFFSRMAASQGGNISSIGGYLGGVITTSSGVTSANWNTAFGWGNHGSAGYLTSLPSHNHDDRYLVKGGSWYGVGLPGSRWGGFSVNGGEIVFGDGLPNAGQMGMLIDGAYLAGENNGFWSLPSDNAWSGRRGMYWNGTYLDFTTNSPTAQFTTLRLTNGFELQQGGSDYGRFSSWVNLNGYYGLYSGLNGAHIYPNNGSYGSWQMLGSRNGWQGIEFGSGSNGGVTLMINADSNTSGFHNNSYGWQFRWNNGTLYCYKNAYGAGTEATVLDSSNYSTWAQPIASAINTGNIGSQSVSYASTAGNSNTVGGYSAAQTYTSTGNAVGSYLGGHYSSGGAELPNSATFGAGKLKLAMLSNGNLGFGGSWNDVLWLSAYSGGDVKGSHALVFDKYSTNVWVSDQNYDSGSWGTGYLLLSTANYNSYSPTLTGTGASGTWGINVTGNVSGTAGSISGFNNPTTASTANTIAYRDASGDIAAREFVLNAATVHTVTPSSIVGIYPTTNQVVKFSASAVQTFLGLGSLAYSSATIPTNNNQLTNGAGYITSSSLSAYLPLAGGSMTGNINMSTDVGIQYSSTHWLRPRDSSGNLHIKADTGGIYLDADVIHLRGVGGVNDTTVSGGHITTAGGYYTNAGLSTNGSNGALTVQSPGGASRANSSSSETGAFKIKLPAGIPVYGMFKLVIHIYEYGQRGNGYEIHCGGHLYPNYMYNRFQVQYGASNSPLTVRYGNDGSTGCIWIGNLDTTWSYPQIWVSEFMIGYSNTSWTTWRSGWSITLDSASFGNSGAMDGPYTCEFGYAATASALASMNISQFTNNSGYITGYTETDTLNSVTGRGSTTLNIVQFGTTITAKGNTSGNGGAAIKLLGWFGASKNWQIDTAFTSGINELAFTPSTTDGGSTFTTPAIKFTSVGGATFNGSISASNLSGTNTGDQTNISGNAATATALTSMNISQFTNNSGYITGYTETDTLNSVTNRGNTTSNSVRFGSYLDISPTTSAFRFYDGTTFRGGFGLDSWGHGGSDANLVLYVNGNNTLFFSTSDIKRASLSSSAFNSLVALQQSGNQVLHAGNYTSYSPSLTGTGASGTWGISVTGSAGSVAWTNVSSRPTALSQFTNDLGNYGGYITSSASISGTASNITAYTINQSVGTGNSPTFAGLANTGGWYSYNDDDRNPGSANHYPTTSARSFRFSFVGAGGVGAAGNYAGLLQFNPWDGTTSSTGDSSYQLAFVNQTGINGSGNPGLRLRKGIDSTWGAFCDILTSVNYTSYSPTLTGTGASGTWSISVSGNAATATNVAYSGLTGTVPTWNQNTTGNAATVGGYAPSGYVGANTVVIRDANNYIFAHYINSNVSETENPTINSFYTSNGDGYFRKSSVAHVKSQLGLGSLAYLSSLDRLSTYGTITSDNWNTYFISGQLIASSVNAHSGSNRPSNHYDYGAALSYGVSGGALWQMYFPENSGNSAGLYRNMAYRTGWNGTWGDWRSPVNQIGQVATVAGSNGTGVEIHSNVGYNQDPLTYFLLRGQADSSWKALKIRLTGDAGGQDIEFRRIAENSTDSRMFYVPRGANQVIFDYAVVTPSDSRLKDNQTPITTPVDKIKSLRGVEFDWNSGEHVGTHDVGLIAQDVEAVLPEAVTTQEDGYKNLAYTKVIPLLVEAMKEQQTMIEALRAEIELLKNK